ncbi:3'(2'),5'-bisphosphate nucleotidase CysQ [Sphingomonas sanguinis]|uniref:3'(2'),5-bisphosphonucleoside 3'(2')-phosphohydrolase n=1 Tax=Sphingomonas sanguinis TaxID=33051 RepID=A0ABU5LLC1_9SPHN|nr:3'(2'),5'-bisphosphate nucleotidase CysQ [Sphingomonas sanguinis]MDZ7280723.1 3'(2'),5'-bisphosphate nucleotidase CysQ [Sphingomonas sanguinis]QXT36353.1 3'(2'),5'-bisphosphate nucleotidase CysQ [Sphingomonas sanguinis]
MTDAELARSVAVEAGALLKTLRASSGLEGKALGALGDRDANTLILHRLRAARPNDFILSEESADDRARCAASRVWIVDPLDGTREYASGSSEWAVHIGLAIDGRPALGAVSVPDRDQVFATDDLPPKHPPCPAGLRVVVSRSRAPDIARCVGDRLGAIMIPMGSAGAKAMAVVEGRADVYLHDGGQYEWDNCAPAAVALAAGLHASRIDGSPLVYNCQNPLLPDLLICRQEVAATVLEAIARG